MLTIQIEQGMYIKLNEQGLLPEGFLAQVDVVDLCMIEYVRYFFLIHQHGKNPFMADVPLADNSGKTVDMYAFDIQDFLLMMPFLKLSLQDLSARMTKLSFLGVLYVDILGDEEGNPTAIFLGVRDVLKHILDYKMPLTNDAV